MSNVAFETAISRSIPSSGRTLLADITHSYHWSDSTLQYYLGNSNTLNFDTEFRSAYNNYYTSGSSPDASFAYVHQTVRAFDMIDAVIATDFTRITNATIAQTSADLVIVTSIHGTSLEGFNQFPHSSTRTDGDYWSFGTITSDLSYMNITPELGGGEYLNRVLIHEIGHSLGLYHPFDWIGTLASVGAAMDNERYTVMSYTGSSLANAYGHAVTMMALDIAALQQQYGTETYAAGSSTYTLYDANTHALRLDENNWDIGRAYASIWDSGGTDTIAYGGTANSVLINLNDATLDRSGVASDAREAIFALQQMSIYNNLSSSLRTEITNPDYHAGGFFSRVLIRSGSTYYGEDGGFSIAYGAQIENATGGANADILIGNELANLLIGGGGNDTLIGGEGNDTLDGGDGVDTVSLDGTHDEFIFALDGALTVTDNNTAKGGNEGTDTLINIETVTFTDGYYAEIVSGSPIPRIVFFADGSAQAASRIRFDEDNAHSWADYTQTFDANDNLTDMVINYDDGRMMDRDCVDGVLTSQFVTDVDNAHSWADYTQTFDANGNLTDMVINYDDGRVMDRDYVDGLLTSQVMTDVDDVYNWASYTQTFDASGALINTVYVDDIV